ncbi:hypothetical protein CBM2586_A50199 [Cupriavidus phytorum]|uniref:Uncharacterized protein n=1 Tax=Cupriavidus taiwanensis TaxID=164546 RepID=A0A976A561_9BURK|nr:hypothetical protein CBM2586_A50199 [Cupriavidus taiwanensis]
MRLAVCRPYRKRAGLGGVARQSP